MSYITDWAYASSESDCETNMRVQDSSNAYICKNNNWMHYGSTYSDNTWYLSPCLEPNASVTSASNSIWFVVGVGFAVDSNAANPFSFFPTLYLKSNVLIESGNGTSSNPYTLKLNN